MSEFKLLTSMQFTKYGETAVTPTGPYDPIHAARRRLGDELRRLRVDADFTQAALATAMNVGSSTVSDLERAIGTRAPEPDVVQLFLTHCLEKCDTPPAIREERRRSLLDQYDNLVRLIDYDQENRKAHARKAQGTQPLTDTLPRDVPKLIGRDRHLLLIEEATTSATGPVPVHVIHGMPGVGKTALAVHAAYRLGDRFRAGRLFLPLHTHAPGRQQTSPLQALEQLLTLDGMDPRALPATIDARAALWRHRTADRQLIMIFDDVGDYGQVEALLPASPGSLIMITSRLRLGVPNCIAHELSPLKHGEAKALLSAIGGARAEPDELDMAVGLCGGLPLAVGIMAGWIQAHRKIPVSDMLAEIKTASQHLREVRHGARSVAAAFEATYKAMTARRQRFFRALGIHLGHDIDGFAAAAIAGISVDEAHEHLSGLFDEHLVEETALRRYRMHDLVAGYAGDLANGDPEAAQMRTRLAAYLTAAARKADMLLAFHREDCPPNPDLELPSLGDWHAAVRWLNNERATISVSIRDFANAGMHDAVIGIAAALAEFLRQYGPWDEAIDIHTLAAESAKAVADRRATAGALQALGEVQRLADRSSESAVSLRAALHEYTVADDRDGIVRTQIALGATLWLLGEYQEAEGLLARALDQARLLGARSLEAAAQAELGTLCTMRDRYTDASTALTAAAGIYDAIGHRLGAARAYRGLGYSFYLSDRYAESQAASKRALAIYKELDHPLGQAQALVNLGGVMRLQGEYEPAETALRTAIGLFHDMQKASSQAQAMTELGALLGSVGRHGEAERTLRVAIAITEAIGDRLCLPAALEQLGEVLRLAHRPEEALSVLDQADSHYVSLDERLGLAAVANVRGAVLLDMGRSADAKAQYETGLQHAQAIGNPLETALAHEGLGRSAHALGTADALPNLREALAIFDHIGAIEKVRVADMLTQVTNSN